MFAIEITAMFNFQLKLQKWDEELAYLAGLNTRNCTFSHDECRNTGISRFCFFLIS